MSTLLYCLLADNSAGINLDEPLLESAAAHWSLLRTDPETGVMDDFIPTWTPMLLKASKKECDPNLPSHADAMTGPHGENFIVACKKETDAMEDRGTWHTALRKDVPKDIKIVPLAWMMKTKVSPN